MFKKKGKLNPKRGKGNVFNATESMTLKTGNRGKKINKTESSLKRSSKSRNL